MNIIKPADIKNESSKIVPQDIIDPSYSSLPLNELSDREFEILIYSLFKEKISKNDWPESSSDQISLMSGVAERGRDCVLYKNDKVSGIIQCKQYKNPYSRPNLLEELTKFLLHSILDEDLIPDIDNFIYFLCISSRLNEPANKLVNSFQNEIETDISNNNINRYIDNNIDRYTALYSLKKTPPYKKIYDLLRKIKVRSYTGIDIINLLYQNPKIKRIFFKSLDDIDIEELQKKLTKDILLGMKDEFGFNLLTDEDLKNIKIRIEDVDDIFRVNLLSSDFFGFHKDFFVYLFDNNKFEYFMKLISNLSIESNKLLIEFLNNEIQKEIIEKITTPLILKGKIHPYMGSFCNMYIFRRLMPEVSINDMSETNYRHFDKYYSMTKKEVISSISENLFISSEKFLSGDFSNITGTPKERQFKITKLLPKIHEGFHSISDVKRRFQIDIQKIMPILDEIEQEIKKLFHRQRTIVITGQDVFDHLKRHQGAKKTFEYMNDHKH